MQKTLISFLGRSPRTEKSGGYRTTSYIIDGQPGKPIAFLGYELLRHYHTDKLVILGTSGSMWDHLFENDLELGAEGEQQRLALIESVEAQNVTQNQLDDMNSLLSHSLNVETRLQLISSAKSEEEQLDLIRIIAEQVNEGDQLSLDVTHGFRHLPMISIMSLLYLQSVIPAVAIEHLWYGEYNPDTGYANVIDLAGLLTLSHWIFAVRQVEEQGDFNAIARLLGHSEIGQHLTNATFFENIHRGSEARKPLKEVKKKLEEQPLTGPAALFQPLLQRRIAWIDDQRLYQRQYAQARQALEQRDFLRATLYAFEAYITRIAQEDSSVKSGKESAYEVRRDLQTALDQDKTFRKTEQGKAYLLLRNLRNALAHGDKPRAQQEQRAIQSPAVFEKSLRDCFDTLFERSGGK